MASSSLPWSWERSAEVVEGARVVRIEAQRLGVAGDGVVQLALRLERIAEVDIGQLVAARVAQHMAADLEREAIGTLMFFHTPRILIPKAAPPTASEQFRFGPRTCSVLTPHPTPAFDLCVTAVTRP